MLVLALLGATGCASARIDRLAAQQRQLEAKIDTAGATAAAAAAAATQLRVALDSLHAQNDSLRRSAKRLEADLLDREEKLRALQLELQRLKEIDLRPRKPPRPH
jgi:chromosome segregation ATPase